MNSQYKLIITPFFPDPLHVRSLEVVTAARPGTVTIVTPTPSCSGPTAPAATAESAQSTHGLPPSTGMFQSFLDCWNASKIMETLREVPVMGTRTYAVSEKDQT